MNIKALAFDAGGTALDWHSELVRAQAGFGSRHGIERDWHAVANDWRRRTMKHIVGQVHPAFHMDDVHRRVLGGTLAEFDLEAISATERDELWRTWHQFRLRASTRRTAQATAGSFVHDAADGAGD
jgi:2-haloacid dehalogenase